MAFLRRQLAVAALTVNALRPSPSFRAGIPVFVAGWLTGELAPHLLTLTAADAVTHLPASRRRTTADRVGLALAAASTAGLTALIAQSRKVGDVVDAALLDGLGADTTAELEAQPTPADVARGQWRRLVNPFRMRDPRIRVDRDVRYSDAGGRGLLDVYRPAEGVLDGAPVLLQVHGGGWTIGSKDEQGLPLMHHMAARGWICVAINYRLAPRDAFPAQVIDVKRAIAWIREHIGEYGGDPDYIAITGGSAGGHLTALAALTPGDPAYQPGFEDADTSVAAAVPHYGVYDFAGATGLKSAEQMRDQFLAPRILQERWRDHPEVFERASPILRIHPDAPDFFVIHGVRDTLVSVDQARLFVDALRRVSRRTVVYAELPGAQHAFDLFPSIRSTQVVRALDKYLHWHWNQWRAGRSPAEPAAIDTDAG
ncbi:alpha/beta hydrolase fold domain-containing protein [Nocardioides taihuensis]|uniref:Alpha/beta hydrolase fold domain-containing protein n=1 Tax=Nocardioides taihuensis TaxID=1835606 RepID=A0ABW0BQ54_9ACTN